MDKGVGGGGAVGWGQAQGSTFWQTISSMTSLPTSNLPPWMLPSSDNLSFLLLLVPLALVIDVERFLEGVFSYGCILLKRATATDCFAVSLIMYPELTWLAAWRFFELQDSNSSTEGLKSPPLSSWSTGAWKGRWSYFLTMYFLLGRASGRIWTCLVSKAISLRFVPNQYYCCLL